MHRTKLSTAQLALLANRKPLTYGRLQYNIQDEYVPMVIFMNRSPTMRKHFDVYLYFSDGHLELEPIQNDPGLCKKPGRKKKGDAT